MAEAVIVATSRTAIGRAGKGSFVDARPDDMSAFIINEVLGKVPELPRDQIEDVIWGTAQPGGEQGYNLGRVAGLLAGLDAPGTTVNRYCSSSLQTIRMAAHAILAGEGDAFAFRRGTPGVRLDCICTRASTHSRGINSTHNI